MDIYLLRSIKSTSRKVRLMSEERYNSMANVRKTKQSKSKNYNARQRKASNNVTNGRERK